MTLESVNKTQLQVKIPSFIAFFLSEGFLTKKQSSVENRQIESLISELTLANDFLKL